MSSKRQLPLKSRIPVKLWNMSLPVGPFTRPLYLSNIMIAILLDNLGQRREFGEESEGWGAGDRGHSHQPRYRARPFPSFPSSTAIRNLFCFICCDLPFPHLFLHLEHGISWASDFCSFKLPRRAIVTSSLSAGEEESGKDGAEARQKGGKD